MRAPRPLQDKIIRIEVQQALEGECSTGDDLQGEGIDARDAQGEGERLLSPLTWRVAESISSSVEIRRQNLHTKK